MSYIVDENVICVPGRIESFGLSLHRKVCQIISIPVRYPNLQDLEAGGDQWRALPAAVQGNLPAAAAVDR